MLVIWSCCGTREERSHETTVSLIVCGWDHSMSMLQQGPTLSSLPIWMVMSCSCLSMGSVLNTFSNEGFNPFNIFGYLRALVQMFILFILLSLCFAQRRFLCCFPIFSLDQIRWPTFPLLACGLSCDRLGLFFALLPASQEDFPLSRDFVLVRSLSYLSVASCQMLCQPRLPVWMRDPFFIT